MKIINWDEETRKKIPSLFGILYKLFGEEVGIAYAIEEDNRLNILAKKNDLVIYIDNREDKVDISSYKIDEEGKIAQFSQGDYQYSYYGNGILSYDSSKGLESSLALIKVGSNDESLEGIVQFKQYDRTTDTQCEIQYNHRYFRLRDEQRARIYSSNLEHISSLMIDENVREFPFKHGYLGKQHHYYTLMDVDTDFRDYYLVALKENGLISLRKNGARNLLGSDHIRRYVKGLYVGRDGNFRAIWPLGKCYKEEDIIKLIQQYGFEAEIPQHLITAYNGNNQLTNKVETLLTEVSEIEKNKDDERILLFKIRP